MFKDLCLPVKVLTDAGVGSTPLRAFYCRYSAVLFYTTMYISILLLGLISLDRYLKIVRPFGKCSLQRVGVGQAVCAAVWVVMVSLALPNMILSNQEPRVSSSGKLKCSSMKNDLGLRWHEGFNYLCQVVFWGTLVLMVICYSFISRKVYESYRASKGSTGAASKRTKAKVECMFLTLTQKMTFQNQKTSLILEGIALKGLYFLNYFYTCVQNSHNSIILQQLYCICFIHMYW